MAEQYLNISETTFLVLLSNSFMGLPCGSSPVVKTLPSNVGGEGSIPGQEAKIPHATWPKNQSIKQKQYCKKFNKDIKNRTHEKQIFKEKK